MLFDQHFCSTFVTGLVKLSLGYQHSMILKEDGSVWSTTASTPAGLAASSEIKKRFVQVISSGAIAMSAGKYFSIVLKQDDSMWGMGRNYNGQLGNGKLTNGNALAG